MSVNLGHFERKDGNCPYPSIPDWNKEFDVHVDASSIALGVVLAQSGEGNIDHPIAFASRNCP